MRRALFIVGSLVATTSLTACVVQNRVVTAVPAALSADAEIRQVEEQFRSAKLHRDVQALDGVLHESFSETNQNGNTRNKPQLLELFMTFPIASLTNDLTSIRVTGERAVVSGSMVEVNSCGVDRMLFTRVYVREGTNWQLLASAQFRDPRSL